MSNIDYEKYKNGGWGLSKKCLEWITKMIQLKEESEMSNNLKPLNILEFGSGDSTRFLTDHYSHHNIESYDNDAKYAFNHECVRVRDLLTCNDQEYETMFELKKYDLESMRSHPYTDVHTRQKNCFYKFQPGDLEKSSYDIVIIDGPNGNGRNLAFLHLMSIVKSGTIIIFDDYRDYDFIPRMKSVLNVKMILECPYGRVNKWETGGDFFIASVI